MGDMYDRLIELLDTNKASYRLIDHAPEGQTDKVSALRGHPVEAAAKCIVLIVKIGKKTSRFVLAVVPGNARVDINKIKSLFSGATYAGFAATDVAERLAGSVAGTVLPFAFHPDLMLIADPSITQFEELFFNAARLDRSMALRTSDYVALAKPRLERIVSTEATYAGRSVTDNGTIPRQHDIRAAYARIKPHVRRTPVIRVDAADFGVTLEHPLTFKLEFLQHSGTFKTRGAFNNFLSRTVPPAGVAAASGGNHGAAVAYAAQKLGHKATIFVPDVSSPVKIARIKSYGADVRVGGARYADALERCEAFIAQSGALSVHAYDAAETIAGQGTVGLEWQADAPNLDTVLVAVGGGGLIAGIAAWFARDVKVVGVEPDGSRALHASLEAGRPVDVTVESIAADSLGARNTGQLVYDIARQNVDHVALVPDDAIVAAQRLLWERLRIAAEPGGAAALGALLSGGYKPRADEKVGVLLCGANVDLMTLAQTGT